MTRMQSKLRRRPEDNRGTLLSRYRSASRLSKIARRTLAVDYDPGAMIAGDPASRGHVFHACVLHGQYELFLSGNGTPGINMIALDGRRGPVAETLADELRRCADFYTRLAARVEARRHSLGRKAVAR